MTVLNPNQISNFPNGLTVIPDGAQGPVLAADRSGNLTISGTLTAGTITGNTEAATNLALSGTLSVGGNTTLSGNLTVAGTSAFTGAVTFGTAVAAATITSLNVSTLTAAGAVLIRGALEADSTSLFRGVTTVDSGVVTSSIDGWLKIGSLQGNNLARIDFLSTTTAKNWRIASNATTNDALEFFPSTGNGGSAFSTATLVLTPGAAVVTSLNVATLTASGAALFQSTVTVNNTLALSGGNAQLYSSNSGNYLQLVAPSEMLVNVGGSASVAFDSTVFYPATNNAYGNGSSGNRWSNVQSVLGNFSGAVTITSLYVGTGRLLTSTVSLTDLAGAQVATITNGPTAGNPTKWIQINDNGTLRSIPAW